MNKGREPAADANTPNQSLAKKRGRPKGSKNKPKMPPLPAEGTLRLKQQDEESHSPPPTLASFEARRFVGVQHRVKTTTAGEERPTRVAILVPGQKKPMRHELGDVRSEIDFAAGVYPMSYRRLGEGEDVSAFTRPWQLKSKELPSVEAKNLAGDDLDATMADLKAGKCAFVNGRSIVLRASSKNKLVLHAVTEVPTEFDGLRPGDLVGMSLGGSGDTLAVLFANYANGGGEIMIARTPTARLKAYRERAKAASSSADKNEEEAGKSKDDVVLAEMVRDERKSFYPVTMDERSSIAVRLAWRRLAEIMDARIAMRQRLIGAARVEAYIRSDRDSFPTGDLTLIHNATVANDVAYLAIVAEEKRAEKALEEALNRLPAYRLILSRVKGIGPRLAGRLVSAMEDIGRFECTDHDAEIAALRQEIVDKRAAMEFEHLLPAVFATRKPDKPDEPCFGGTRDTSRHDFNWWQATQIARSLTQAELDAQPEETDRIELERRLGNLDEILHLMKKRAKLKKRKFHRSRSRFVAYNGLNPDPKTGQFRRQRKGELANWSKTGRQTGYLLTPQMLKLPRALYGRYLIALKRALREKHPEVVVEAPKNGKAIRKYTDGHIQSMAGCRLATRFFEWFFREAWRLRQDPAGYRFQEPQYPSIATMMAEVEESSPSDAIVNEDE